MKSPIWLGVAERCAAASFSTGVQVRNERLFCPRQFLQSGSQDSAAASATATEFPVRKKKFEHTEDLLQQKRFHALKASVSLFLGENSLSGIFQPDSLPAPLSQLIALRYKFSHYENSVETAEPSQRKGQ